MPLHLLKLSVGVDSLGELQGRVAAAVEAKRMAGQPLEHIHTTRMVPKRAAELLDGGSLFWVVRRQVMARQEFVGIRPFVDGEGVGRCHLALAPRVVPVALRPCRPFQGWRYLDDEKRPRDLAHDAGMDGEMPEQLRVALSELCLI